MMTKDEVIAKFNLVPLPLEGGFYRETYRSTRLVQSALGERREGTAIYYLVTEESFSALHVVDQDEIFHFYAGDAVEMFQILPDGTGRTIVIGNQIHLDETPQVIVPHGIWQGTKLRNPRQGGWALLGCNCAPGFEYENFHMKTRAELTAMYPQHVQQIANYTVS